MAATTLRQRAYKHIHRKLMSGQLPAGGVISEHALAREIKISRTPVREAIQQLEIEGLVEQIPRYGTIVHQPTRQEIIELFELCEALESYATEQAAQRMSEDDLALLTRLCQRMRAIAQKLDRSRKKSSDAESFQRFLALDMGFHMALLRAAGNRKIIRVIAESHVLAGIFGARRQPHDLSTLVQTYRCHGRIIRALRAKRGARARRLIVEHIRASKQAALDFIDQSTPSPQSDGEIPLPLPQDMLEELQSVQ